MLVRVCLSNFVLFSLSSPTLTRMSSTQVVETHHAISSSPSSRPSTLFSNASAQCSSFFFPTSDAHIPPFHPPFLLPLLVSSAASHSHPTPPPPSTKATAPPHSNTPTPQTNPKPRQPAHSPAGPAQGGKDNSALSHEQGEHCTDNNPPPPLIDASISPPPSPPGAARSIVLTLAAAVAGASAGGAHQVIAAAAARQEQKDHSRSSSSHH